VYVLRVLGFFISTITIILVSIIRLRMRKVYSIYERIVVWILISDIIFEISSIIFNLFNQLFNNKFVLA
jgi:hypothetical protein